MLADFGADAGGLTFNRGESPRAQIPHPSDLEKQSLRKISGVDRNHEGLARGMFQNQVGTRLAGSAIPLPQKKADEFASGNHSVQRERNRLRVNGAGRRNGPAFLAAVPDVEAHGLQDAFLGLLDGLPETVDAGKIVAVGVVALAIAFDGYGVAVKGHPGIKSTMKKSAGLAAQWREDTG